MYVLVEENPFLIYACRSTGGVSCLAEQGQNGRSEEEEEEWKNKAAEKECPSSGIVLVIKHPGEEGGNNSAGKLKPAQEEV